MQRPFCVGVSYALRQFLLGLVDLSVDLLSTVPASATSHHYLHFLLSSHGADEDVNVGGARQ